MIAPKVAIARASRFTRVTFAVIYDCFASDLHCQRLNALG
jgi:hypothetical protein